MEMSFIFVLNSIGLGIGLAMDAFSVSIVNGMNEPCMQRGKVVQIAGCYAFFQWAMPMIGWFCVHSIAQQFEAFRPFIPWIALILLLLIGGNMLREGIGRLRKNEPATCEDNALTWPVLILQGVATSIDALSVGFTIAKYGPLSAFTASLIIAVVTFFICFAGLHFGRKFGEKIADKSTILGGLILIAIGLEIFITG